MQVHAVAITGPVTPNRTELSISFVADSGISTILLEPLALLGKGGVTLDWIRVTEVVSCPSTITLIAMALLSMLGLGMMRRRAEA
jgi:hypothetical protein